MASEVRLIKFPPPGSPVFGPELQQKFMEKSVYPEWEEEKKANKIEYNPPKEIFTPEQKARLGKKEAPI